MKNILFQNSKRIFLLFLYIFIIFYITIIVRIPNSVSTVNIIPLKAFESVIKGNSRQLSQILLNIVLFIPMGYVLRQLIERKAIAISVAFVFSLLIEVLQYILHCGQFDVDDLINNTIGAVIGVELWIKLKDIKGNVVVSYIFLVLGITSCIIIAQQSNDAFLSTFFKEYDFHIISVSCSGSDVSIEGECFFYSQNTPGYSLFLDDHEMETLIQDKHFIASSPITAGKHEVKVHFSGYQVLTTGTYLSLTKDGNIAVEYVPSEIQIPFTIPKQYILKAYNPDQITYVFEDPVNNHVLWYIGWDITPSTEVIYHIQTDEPEKLPDKRIQYGFDNRGFRVKEKNMNELDSVDGFRVFEREIPNTYNVTAILVGFNTSGTITWKQYFRQEK